MKTHPATPATLAALAALAALVRPTLAETFQASLALALALPARGERCDERDDSQASRCR
ncbi:hypothetical protein AB0I89_16850 [Micromonospora sp. NPDC049801]|uniref:hypothetical protein n=1 Tax=unclassified Micromonospora TaxID=2617518 RepID=UPI0033C5BFFB